MIKLYGIKNCDTVKKARKWLEAESIEYSYHDFRKDGLTADIVAGMLDGVGADALINKRGTTWRKISPEEQAAAETDTAEFLATHEAIIKRPVWHKGGAYRVGFKTKEMAELMAWLEG